MNKKVIIAFVIMAVASAGIIFGFFMLSRYANTAEPKVSDTSELGKLINKDLEIDYPATPREVVKLYNRLNSLMYDDETKDESFEGLLKQMRLLFDDELLRENAYENHLENFKQEREQYKKEKKTIVSYNLPENSAVQYYELDGADMASLSVGYMLREKEDYTKMNEEFILRKDADGRWKIMGWSLEGKETKSAEEKKED